MISLILFVNSKDVCTKKERRRGELDVDMYRGGGGGLRLLAESRLARLIPCVINNMPHGEVCAVVGLELPIAFISPVACRIRVLSSGPSWGL